MIAIIIYPNPNCKKVRGSHILTVSCAHCKTFIANYQKVGESNFVKMYNRHRQEGRTPEGWLLRSKSAENGLLMACWTFPNITVRYSAPIASTGQAGRVVYVDPYAGEGYDLPANLILVSHQHGNHNRVDLCAKKPECKIISNVEALQGGKHNSFDIDGIQIQVVEAYNVRRLSQGQPPRLYRCRASCFGRGIV